MTEQRDALLRLASAGLHPDRMRSLVAEWGNATAVVRAIDHGQIAVGDRSRRAVAVSAQERHRELDRLGVTTIATGDPGFPSGLAELPDSPSLLYVRGALPTEPAVAVVGTRRCTTYGRRLAEAYGRAIGEAGWVLVSGLARGIDGAAHTGTVAVRAKGIAVLGCGPDIAYPREHVTLGQRIVEHGGAVVTEYPPGTPPEGWRFPPRNRIISGLSSAVVVVEAGVTGGALITAAYALEHALPVLAVPGDVDRATSRGTNLLIRDGAIPVLDPEDLVEALSLVLGPPQPSMPRAEADGVLRGFIGPTPRSIDSLVAATGLSPAELMGEITRLEADGVVFSDGLNVSLA